MMHAHACWSLLGIVAVASALQSACTRQDVLRCSSHAIAAGLVLEQVILPQQAHALDDSLTFSTYKVTPDASAQLNPLLTRVEVSMKDLPYILMLVAYHLNLLHCGSQTHLHTLQNTDFVNRLAQVKTGAVWLGEHHNSQRDHLLQDKLIRRLSSMRRRQGKTLAIGLEQVQRQFQPVLDEYKAGKLSLDELKRGVQWDKRWSWSFDGYAPIFDSAVKLGIPLIALNVDSEDLQLVEVGGLPGLPRDRLQQYISDP
jgi:Haem-binding uptake, Tiki superfamily, ChaN